jgi:hypothetical protein
MFCVVVDVEVEEGGERIEKFGPTVDIFVGVVSESFRYLQHGLCMEAPNPVWFGNRRFPRYLKLEGSW